MKLTVVIPAYNAQDTIGASVAAAWETGADEVIVVDDGSTDRTAQRAERGHAVVLSQVNAGAAAARRRGIEVARGEVIALLDADDQLVAPGFAASLNMLGASPRTAVVVGATLARDKRGRARVIRPWPEGVNTRSLLIRGMSLGPPAAQVWRRSALVEALSEPPPGLWPKFAEDYELLLRGSMVGDVKTHDAVVCIYNLGEGRSARHPLHDNRDAERVRRHYASLSRTPIRLRSDAELRALAHLRRAYDRPGGRNLGRRLVHYAAAMVLHPAYGVQAGRRLLRHGGTR